MKNTTLHIMAIVQMALGLGMLGAGVWLRYPRWVIMGPIVAALALTLWR